MESAKQAIARRAVRSAIARGELTRPIRCSRCGVEPGLMKDGRPMIQGHHHRGYDRPLDVEWLCVKCHRSVTPFPARENTGGYKAPQRGVDNPQAKLNDAKVGEILARLANGEMGCSLATEFGVSAKQVSDIKNRKWWRHVKAPALIAKDAQQ